MYELYIEHKAEKDLGKLPPQYFKLVVAKIKKLSYDPHPKGSRKIIGTENFWRIRIGSYRVLYEIIESELTIRIYKIAHRKDIYK